MLKILVDEVDLEDKMKMMNKDKNKVEESQTESLWHG